MNNASSINMPGRKVHTVVGHDHQLPSYCDRLEILLPDRPVAYGVRLRVAKAILEYMIFLRGQCPIPLDQYRGVHLSDDPASSSKSKQSPQPRMSVDTISSDASYKTYSSTSEEHHCDTSSDLSKRQNEEMSLLVQDLDTIWKQFEADLNENVIAVIYLVLGKSVLSPREVWGVDIQQPVIARKLSDSNEFVRECVRTGFNQTALRQKLSREGFPEPTNIHILAKVRSPLSSEDTLVADTGGHMLPSNFSDERREIVHERNVKRLDAERAFLQRGHECFSPIHHHHRQHGLHHHHHGDGNETGPDPHGEGSILDHFHSVEHHDDGRISSKGVSRSCQGIPVHPRKKGAHNQNFHVFGGERIIKDMCIQNKLRPDLNYNADRTVKRVGQAKLHYDNDYVVASGSVTVHGAKKSDRHQSGIPHGNEGRIYVDHGPAVSGTTRGCTCVPHFTLSLTQLRGVFTFCKHNSKGRHDQWLFYNVPDKPLRGVQ